jgi:hypothetical protein
MSAMRWCAIAFVAIAIGVAAGCHSAPSAAPTPAASSPPAPLTRIISTGQFSPKSGEAAVQAFQPAVAAADSGGECSVTRTSGSGATTAAASFPSRAAPQMRVTLTFDSAGHLARYSEMRGMLRMKMPPGVSDAQRDSVLHAAIESARSTTISLEWAIDQAILSNRGGGQPTDAVLTTVRRAQAVQSLGMSARIERVRKLCGV